MSGLLIAAELPIAKPGCPERCGNVSIPYPFGIGSGCYHDPAFEIVCNSSVHPSKAFLSSFNLEVEDITIKTIYDDDNYDEVIQSITVKTPVERSCGIQNANISSLDFGGTPYWFSGNDNVFLFRGCESSVTLRNASNDVLDGCSLLCDGSHVQAHDKVSPFCIGVECCTLYPGDMNSFSLNIHTYDLVSNNCTSAMLVGEAYLNKMQLDDPSSPNLQLTTVSTVLGWMLPNSSALSSVGDTNRSCYNYTYAAKMERGMTYEFIVNVNNANEISVFA
ncbi:Wall-associated receptor kinase-like 8 [Bienertia sinuspersici]